MSRYILAYLRDVKWNSASSFLFICVRVVGNYRSSNREMHWKHQNSYWVWMNYWVACSTEWINITGKRTREMCQVVVSYNNLCELPSPNRAKCAKFLDITTSVSSQVPIGQKECIWMSRLDSVLVGCNAIYIVKEWWFETMNYKILVVWLCELLLSFFFFF